MVPTIPLRPTDTDLTRLLSGAMEPLQEQAAQRDVSLRIDAPESLPHVTVDAEKIAWAVTTLVGNSLRYVRRGSRHFPGGSIDVHIAREGDDLSITVEDDGPGIPKEKLPWLFRRAPGTPHSVGLALMLIHDVVVAHGGTVGATSATEGPDRGTRVTLRLPHAISVSHGGAAES